ncbi:hypothetical protein Y032_0296g1684 [Ancylostoma ceylanicum]|uniref:Nose resistant-to-fluoxetine protein N-terminal domain-containing protein n=1 Tax=Ancylostoma ceylanicum TaxID=53326 RepID=A0A016S5N9_9BILA|nr:hypothetical protein Y032_0296g1684 [Ancylostoma ceylanicum]
MRLHIIVLFLITDQVNCIYPQLNSDQSSNVSTVQLETHRKTEEFATRNLEKKTSRWKQYNKFIKKLAKIVESVQLAGESQCLVDLSSILSGASTVLAAAPLCALYLVQQCHNDLAYSKLWVIDSWPRLPSGVTRKGPFFFLGDYDICLESWTESFDSAANTTFRTHYCRAQTTVTLSQGSVLITSELVFKETIETGFCLPSSCHEDAVSSLANRFLDEFFVSSDKVEPTFALDGITCHGTDEQWPSVKRTLAVVCTAVLMLLLVATIVDAYFVNMKPSSVAESVSDACTITGSELTVSFDGNDALRRMNCFNAPSIALTYKHAPDLPRSLVRPAIVLDILCSFSLRVSLKHLSRKTAREIPCLNGIKVLSSLWVILGHSCIFTLSYMDNITTFLPELAKSRWLAPVLLNSSLAVDSFLFISGAVAAFTVRKRILFRENDKFSFFRIVYRLFMFYFHRLSRLWPALLMTTLFVRYVYNHLGDGPMWSTQGVFGTTCSSETVWHHLLFVSNWFPSHCLPWLWYTAVDFQLYLFSPFFFLLLPRYPRSAFLIGVVLVVGSMIYTTSVYAVHSLPTNIFTSALNPQSLGTAESSFRLLYASPAARCSPFIIGLLTGWTVSVRNEKQPSTGICLLLKIVAVSLLYFALFAPFCKEGLRSYIHAVLHRTTWSVALAILVWLCENGLAPEISFLLSSHRLLLFSRLSFGVFLAHEPILLFYIWTSRQAHTPRSFMFFVVFTLTAFVLSLIVALIITLTIEIPILSMERKLLKTADRGYEEDHPSGNEPDWRKERSSVEEEPNYHEKATAWLRTPEFNEASAPPFQEFHAPNFQEDRLPASGIPTAMECASTFSMDSFFWCGKEGHQEDWSREPSLIDKFDREAEERLLPKRPIDLEQWEKSLFSTC